jgi:hypothetical protein
LPGNSLSFEPGVTWSPRRQDSFSVYVPIAVHRHAGLDANSQSMHMTGPGLATIADWQLIVSYTHEF